MKIAINGFGRIGRLILKIALQRKLNVVAINDLHGPESSAYLLKYDSTYGKFPGSVEHGKDSITVNGKKIKVVSEKDPLMLPWKELGIDLVIESSGVFTHGRDAEKHIQAGAKRVIITAPAEDADITVVPGVNERLLRNQKLISVGSCTTNCTAPLANLLLKDFGIIYSMLTTVHAYTNDQVVQDAFHKNMRRGRSAAENIIPTTTGASEAVIQAIPQLKGKMTGLSIRVPVKCGSLIDLTVEVKKKTSVQEVNTALEKASKTTLKGIVEYSKDALVSSDIIGNPHSAIIDSLSTQVDGNLVKILAWYDNEFGYSNRVVDVVEMLR